MIADLNHQALSYQDGEEYWKERQESCLENMKEEEVTVEKDIWVFADLGPEQFDFFYLDEGDDPKVYYYCAYLDGEGDNEYAGFLPHNKTFSEYINSLIDIRKKKAIDFLLRNGFSTVFSFLNDLRFVNLTNLFYFVPGSIPKKMKYTGFISEIDDYAFAKSLKRFYLTVSPVNTNSELIIAYLKSGTLCVPFMGVAEDEDETVMGKISVLTDGEWFWPDYLASFIKKYPNFRIDIEFEKQVLKNRGNPIHVDDVTLATLEKEFLANTGFK